MKFKQYLADRLESLEWRHFGVGCLQAYLHEGSDYEQRIHIWHHNLVAYGIQGNGDTHNHRFSFVSKVLAGKIFNRTLACVPVADGNHDIYTVVNAREAKAKTGTYDCETTTLHRANLIEVGYQEHSAGEEYEFEAGLFHETSFSGLTITLVTKFGVIPNFRAQIAVPHGRKLVHAFDENRQVDVRHFVNFAKNLLTCG